MTAACVTFEQIESSAASTVAWAIHARRIRDGFVALTFGAAILAYFAHKLEKLVITLRSGALSNLSDEQLIELAELLKQLNGYVLRLGPDFAASGVTEYSFLKPSIQSIQDSAEDLESILENIYLALDPGFHKAVSSAIDKMNLGVEARATLLR